MTAQTRGGVNSTPKDANPFATKYRGNDENNEEPHVYRSRALYRRQVGERRRPQGRGRAQSGDREAAGAPAPCQQGRSRRGAGSGEERPCAVAGEPVPQTPPQYSGQ